ncbi:MAG: LacI family DNA-binding transcriptional regulator [Bacteroidetes bacterium]|nr:LacI family DNA-binding transcriptional regulator [Bacteroidota bacterium]
MSTKKPPTIYDVAEAAGVSVSTVSRVLNNQNKVSDDICERVISAVALLGYKRLKRESRASSYNTIGLIVPDITNPYYSTLIKGVQNTAYTFNYHVVFCESENDPVLAEKQIYQLIDQDISGLIFIPPMHFKKSISIPVPLVFLDRKPTTGTVHNYVGVDNELGAYNATKYLLSLGHQSILYLGGSKDISTEPERFAGYSRAMKEVGQQILSDHILECEYSWERAKQLVVDKFADRSFTAIFGSNDLMAFGALEAMKESGLRYPQDLSIVGFDDLPYSKLLSLTSIAQPTLQMGQNAFFLLVDLINGDKIPPQKIILPTSINIRNSCMQNINS